ncbi:MAG TPA: carboxypeptidase regulatory-like domain-containing protein [Candidatus Acidoferrum sp.]|nr:carboxypeptidase regulatory-like domain-containing protein [Candidatus Acidoferrum sp.]
MLRRHSVFVSILLCVVTLAWAASAMAQVNTATLSGVVTDPQGLAVRGAKVTITNPGTGAERSAVTDDGGHYKVVGLQPGTYRVSVDGGANFALYRNEAVVVTVGADDILNPQLELKGVQQTVTVTTETAPIETTKTEVSQTVNQLSINNLPINGRNYINFTLTNSQTTRDVSPTIGPAPNSGLNIDGARARSNMVSVDGADAGDNSVDGIRSTVSQEAVQEFQLILSNYNAEYGRATGGVINIVTKSGTNQTHGDIFGYLRNKAFQSRNPFSGLVDPTTGQLDPVKQAYTRVQTGFTLGGALKKDKTFYFLSYEYTQREETDFSSIGVSSPGTGPFGMIPVTLGPGLTVQLTPSQASAVQQLELAGQTTLAGKYAGLMGSASSVALNRLDYGLVAPALTSGLVNPGPGPQFPIPMACPVSSTIGTVTCSSIPVAPGAGYSFGVAGLPASFVGLNTIRGNFPGTEKTSLWSARLDQRWNNRNSSFLRVGVSPSLVTGLESTSQNQVFGQNAGSRAGVSQYRDLTAIFQHDTILSDTAFNEFRFQGARRGLHFGFSSLPGGSNIGVNIPGYAYFGREPYSTVDRIERRFEWTDNLSLIRGNHTFKFGGDFNLIQLRSNKPQIFELDFGGDVNFGGLAASDFGFPNCVGGTGAACTGGIALPGATGLQAYGLGIPTSYIQGIGNASSPFDNIPMAFFAQDSWKATRRITLNYGLRYDLEITPLFAPATAVNAAAEKALGVQEGVPRDYKNIAPRFGIAWDPTGDGKTVVRAGYGLFFDHPLLAIAFDSTTADGGRSVQLLSAGGTATSCGLLPLPSGSPTPPGFCGSNLDSPANLNGSTIFQGALNANSIYAAFPTSLTLGYLPQQQRFDPFAAGSLFANQAYLQSGFPLSILPFTLPVTRNFTYAYAQQANLTVERELAGSWKLSVGYQWTRGLHLYRPIDLNSTDPQLLDQNAFNAAAAGLPVSNPLTVVAPSANVGATRGTCGVTVIAPAALGILNNCPAPIASLNGQYVSTPAFFNFFRKSGPNPSFASLVAPGAPLNVGYAVQQQLAGLAGYPQGFGAPVPFNSVDAQNSNGNSWYNALTVNVSKRFSKGFEMLSSYTWSHSIDDGTDLQSPLEPQDSRFPNFERSNSVNDQRHRWVTSGVYQTPSAQQGDSFWKHFGGDITISPIVEVSSGRPYNVITGEDTRLDLGASQARPSVVKGSATGTTSPYVPGVTFVLADVCLTNSGTAFTVPGFTTAGAGCVGNLGRNAFRMPGWFTWDMRVAKRIPVGERLKLDLIADAFNLFNRTNITAVNQLCDPSAGSTCSAGQPSAAYDARQFQFALKLTW